MKNNKMVLSREIVKYIFPATEPTVREDEGGYVVYNFIRIYPNKLGIFIPDKVDRSNYSSFFPKSFGSYFTDMYEESEYLSRLLEVPIEPNLDDIGVECVSGKILRKDEDGRTIFRFDDLLDPRSKTDLLCRVNINELTIDDKIDILSTNPEFRDSATAADGVSQYFYWIMPLSRLFRLNDEVLAAIFAFANTLRDNKGPF